MSAPGDIVRRLREQRYWSIDEMRDAAKSDPDIGGYSSNWYGHFERGTVKPKEPLRRGFARIFGLTLEQFDAKWRKNLKPLQAAESAGIPLINLTRAGQPVNYHEHGTTSRQGFTYLPRDGETQSEDLFAVRVVGDSMAPRILEGDDVILWPVPEGHPEDKLEGRVVFVHFRDDDTNCLARFHWGKGEDPERGRRVHLRKDNPKRKGRDIWFGELDQLAVMVQFRGRA